MTLKLIEKYRLDSFESIDGSPMINYNIVLDDTVIGYIDLSLSLKAEDYCYGHIGYAIFEDFRGHHYARQACEQLLEIIAENNLLSEVIITASPHNIASIKTIEALKAEYLETIKLPFLHELSLRGEGIKRIYRIKI